MEKSIDTIVNNELLDLIVNKESINDIRYLNKYFESILDQNRKLTIKFMRGST